MAPEGLFAIGNNLHLCFLLPAIHRQDKISQTTSL